MLVFVSMMSVLIIITICAFISASYSLPKFYSVTKEEKDYFTAAEEEELIMEEFIAYDQAKRNR